MATRRSDSQKKPTKGLATEVFELAPAAALKDVFQVSDIDLLNQKMNEIIGLLWLPKTLSETDRNARIVKATELFESLAPTDSVEAMLALQMVGTHSAAMECLRRAMIPDQLLPAFDTNLRSAQKLMALFTRQMEALNRHRGKGQQKVTVEYVNVEPGAQAIVGSVETGRSPQQPQQRRTKKQQTALEGSAVDLSSVAPASNRKLKSPRS